jgi:hypothetical protein
MIVVASFDRRRYWIGPGYPRPNRRTGARGFAHPDRRPPATVSGL